MVDGSRRWAGGHGVTAENDLSRRHKRDRRRRRSVYTTVMRRVSHRTLSYRNFFHERQVSHFLQQAAQTPASHVVMCNNVGAVWARRLDVDLAR